MFAVKPDRIMVYVDNIDTDWITLRVAIFHYTLFKTDILDVLEIANIEIPKWLEILIDRAQNTESRPIPEAPFPQSLPTLTTLRNMIPTMIETGMSFPTWDGSQVAGLVINPGGMPGMTDIPYKARLMTGTFLGLNLWLQSGMMNGAGCLVSQALLFYQRDTKPRAPYPLLDTTGYLPGQMSAGATIWHVGDLQTVAPGVSEAGYAHNEIQYSGGHYYIDRNYYADCPVPEYPEGHFMRPMPGAKMTMTTTPGVLGRYRLWLQDDYHDGNDLDLIPYGCQPGWPDDTYLAQFGLYNDDSVGINSFSNIVALPGFNIWPNANTPVDGWGDVVWQEEDTAGTRFGILPAYGAAMLALHLLSCKSTRLVVNPNHVDRKLTYNGDVLTLNSNPLEL
jgi:hypothetical protein